MGQSVTHSQSVSGSRFVGSFVGATIGSKYEERSPFPPPLPPPLVVVQQQNQQQWPEFHLRDRDNKSAINGSDQRQCSSPVKLVWTVPPCSRPPPPPRVGERIFYQVCDLWSICGRRKCNCSCTRESVFSGGTVVNNIFHFWVSTADNRSARFDKISEWVENKCGEIINRRPCNSVDPDHGHERRIGTSRDG